jgi:RNA polymerase sigma-70 factor (ECF subfamily)
VTACSTSVATSASSAPPLATVSAVYLTVDLTLATDAELGQALMTGHPDAPSVAWRRFLPLVRRMLRRTLGDRNEVEDVAQAVFLCFFRRVHALRDPLALRAFVIGIALRVVHEEVRRRRRQRRDAQTQALEDDHVVVAADAVPKHAFANLHRLVQRLKHRERAAFMLRFVQGLDTAEVAEALGVSEPTARRSFSRAHRLVMTWAQHDPFLVDYLR